MSKPATEEAILKTFFDSTPLKDLREENKSLNGERILRQSKGKGDYAKPDPNILPSFSTPLRCNLDDYFTGNLQVETQVKSGSFVDRLGNKFDVWESQIPPADKDYSSTAPKTSQRHLERAMGHDPRPPASKKEVKGITNPGESKKSRFTEERSATLEFSSRDTFFNQAHVQIPANIDSGREMYDGHNVKNRISIPLEHSWREQLSKPTTVRKQSNIPVGTVARKATLKRQEPGPAFNRTQQMYKETHGIRNIPFLPEATLRANEASHVSLKSVVQNDKLINGSIDHNVKKEFEEQIPHSVKLSSGSVVSSDFDQLNTSRGDTTLTLPTISEATLNLASSPRADHEIRNLHREVEPQKSKPSINMEIAQRIVEGIGDHDTTDDNEIKEIINHDMIVNSRMLGGEKVELAKDVVHNTSNPRYQSTTFGNLVASKTNLPQTDDIVTDYMSPQQQNTTLGVYPRTEQSFVTIQDVVQNPSKERENIVLPEKLISPNVSANGNAEKELMGLNHIPKNSNLLVSAASSTIHLQSSRQQHESTTRSDIKTHAPSDRGEIELLSHRIENEAVNRADIQDGVVGVFSSENTSLSNRLHGQHTGQSIGPESFTIPAANNISSIRIDSEMPEKDNGSYEMSQGHIQGSSDIVPRIESRPFTRSQSKVLSIAGNTVSTQKKDRQTTRRSSTEHKKHQPKGSFQHTGNTTSTQADRESTNRTNIFQPVPINNGNNANVDSLRPEPNVTNTYSGQSEVDRIHTPRPISRQSLDARVTPTTNLGQDRSVSNRVPSRNGSIQHHRVTPTVQYDSNRGNSINTRI